MPSGMYLPLDTCSGLLEFSNLQLYLGKPEGIMGYFENKILHVPITANQRNMTSLSKKHGTKLLYLNYGCR